MKVKLKKLELKEKKFLSKKREKEKSEEEERDDIIVGEKEVAFLLDKRKRITVHKFKGQLKVDIREYYEDNGEMKPGKKGISLNNDNWQKLKEFVDKIDENPVIRAAYIHILGDMIQSSGVLLAALCIYFFQQKIIFINLIIINQMEIIHHLYLKKVKIYPK